MKKSFAIFLTVCSFFAVLYFSACNARREPTGEDQPTRNVVELTEENSWKYLDISLSGAGASGSKGSIKCTINGVLEYALYENVVIAFEVFYYTAEQPEEEYQSYVMFIALNAAGDAKFETTYLGVTNVTLGKWNGYEGVLVNLQNYNRKIYMKSITGKVIYTI